MSWQWALNSASLRSHYRISIYIVSKNFLETTFWYWQWVVFEFSHTEINWHERWIFAYNKKMQKQVTWEVHLITLKVYTRKKNQLHDSFFHRYLKFKAVSLLLRNHCLQWECLNFQYIDCCARREPLGFNLVGNICIIGSSQGTACTYYVRSGHWLVKTNLLDIDLAWND